MSKRNAVAQHYCRSESDVTFYNQPTAKNGHPSRIFNQGRNSRRLHIEFSEFAVDWVHEHVWLFFLKQGKGKRGWPQQLVHGWWNCESLPVFFVHLQWFKDGMLPKASENGKF